MYKNSKEKKRIIERLKTKDRSRKLYHRDIPKEYIEDEDIIKEERKIGMRKVDRIGFDVIRQIYFVHESVLEYNYSLQKEIWKKTLKTFEEFDSYYNYLDGI